MGQKTKLIHFFLAVTFGIVSLFLAFAPYTLIEVMDANSDSMTTELRSNIRFSEKKVQLEPVHPGETSSGFIFVENTGNKIISNVAIMASCICSNLELSDMTINPSESIKIEFSIDTSGKYGDFDEHFLFTYSENSQNLFDVFYVTVPILAPGKIVAAPSSLQFFNAKVGELFSRDIVLQVKDMPENETVDIVDVVAPDWIFIDFAEKDAGWQLTLSGTYPNQSGRYVEFIRILSSSKRYSETIIPFIIEYALVSTDGVITTVEIDEP
jgi:hypothetical protein